MALRLVSQFDPSIWLTRRQVEVLVLLGHGLSRKQAAMRLGIAVDTVAEHLNHCVHHLRAGSRVEAFRIAVEHRLIQLSPPSEGRDGDRA